MLQRIQLFSQSITQWISSKMNPYMRSRIAIATLVFVVFLITLIGVSKPDLDTSSFNLDAWSAPKSPAVNGTTQNNTDVLIYVYYEEDNAKQNFQFFLKHALHNKMDFIFVINGDVLSVTIPEKDNIQVIRRENTCYDLGTYSEIVTANDNAIMERYKRFLFVNASIRGPFLPFWGRTQGICWSSVFLDMISETTKLVGLTANCNAQYNQHLQSMLLATDRLGLDLILPSFICTDNMEAAINEGETTITARIREAGYDAVPMYSDSGNAKYANYEDYWSHCTHADIFWPQSNAGMDVHPYDTIFVKTKRASNAADSRVFTENGQTVLDRLTEWSDASEYSSYDYC